MKNFARGDSVRPGFYDQEVKQTQQSGRNMWTFGLKIPAVVLESIFLSKKWIFQDFGPKSTFFRNF